jgi:poly(3-hydroxybutyrate) depolymerase
MLSYRLICEASDVFYGAAPGAGEYYGNSLLGYTCNPPVQRPVLHMHGTADLVINYVLASNAYQDYVRNVQGCPITTSFKYGNPLYYAMTCVERSPCNGNTASTHCTYNLMGHQWPTNGLLRAWNYFTTGRL